MFLTFYYYFPFPVELCKGPHGIPLRDHDSTSKKDGDWSRINTLGHYDIPLMVD